VEPLVAAPAMDQVGATGAVDAGAMAAGAELIVAVAADDPLAARQPEHEVDTTGHPDKSRPRGCGHLRVTPTRAAGSSLSSRAARLSLSLLAPAFPSTAGTAAPTQTITAKAPTSARVPHGKATVSMPAS
jgi:hypothetical protein